jgi:hypothetical protein
MNHLLFIESSKSMRILRPVSTPANTPETDRLSEPAEVGNTTGSVLLPPHLANEFDVNSEQP